MAFMARVLLDSVSPDGLRLSSVLMTYPRFIHAEIMTHRDRARNAASSRAIPWRKAKPGKNIDGIPVLYCQEDLIDNCMAKMILTDPVVPIVWGREQSGMQTGGSLPDHQAQVATKIWLEARDQMIEAADKLAAMGVHKSLCNRLTEPWMWITVIMTATEWRNFFRLRVHPDAEVHFQRVAGMIRTELAASEPTRLRYGEWHMPFLHDYERVEIADLTRSGSFEGFSDFVQVQKRVSAARCARLSYLTHEGKRDYKEDLKLCAKLIERSDDVLHASPLEHTAECGGPHVRSGPFRGWKQMRKEFPNENVEGHI